MSHNKYLLVIGAAGLLSWIAWILVILKFNPFESVALPLALFFISLAFALMCTFTVGGFYFRLWINKNEIYYNHINIALRQGLLLTVITMGCLTLQLLRVLTWWSGLLFIAAVTMVEFYFLAQDTN